MKQTNLKILIEQLVTEFLEDLGKRTVVITGLPASGKSTFINKEINKYIHGFKGYKVSNSDSQVKALQYITAQNHYKTLSSNLHNTKKNLQKVISVFKSKSSYVSNRKTQIIHPITLDWWNENKNNGFKKFWMDFYKPYYATYFDIRSLAKEIDKQLFNTKIKKAGNILVIDTVGASPDTLLARLQKLHDNDYNNTIIYLEIDPELCIVRDRYREETEGRGVGEEVIFAYTERLDNAISTYKQNAEKQDSIVDRILHFKWKPSGDSPIKGTWIKISDNRYSIKRKLKK